jgi:methionyl-tRNA synthetase
MTHIERDAKISVINEVMPNEFLSLGSQSPMVVSSHSHLERKTADSTCQQLKPDSEDQSYLVTAALPYSNGDLHVGHIAGAYLPADIYSRFLRLRGKKVRTVCGSDDYGVAIMLSAERAGTTPAAIAEHFGRRQQQALEALNIKFDIFSSTSRNPHHKKTSQDFFLSLAAKNYFEKIETEQFFDPQRGIFLPDRFVRGSCGFCNADNQNGDQCEECGSILDFSSLKSPKSVISGHDAITKRTTHWFLDLSRCSDSVEKWLETADVREKTKKYVRSLIESGLVKRSMTRDIPWGIPVPLDDPDAGGKVLYVWFDAPLGYISNTKELCEQQDGDPEKFADWWKNPNSRIVHFIGEDNTIFHSIIWIAMLSAEASYQLPHGVVVNHFLNIKFPERGVEKISKSRGSAVWILDYVNEGGSVDGLRYYLTAVAPESARTVYQSDDLERRYNVDLADTLGNFVSRVVQFSKKHFADRIPSVQQDVYTPVDEAFRDARTATFEKATEALEKYSFKAALELLIEYARVCNRYFDAKAPWRSIKEGDIEQTAVTVFEGLSAAKFLAVCLSPYLPTTSEKILSQLSLNPSQTKWDDALLPLEMGSKLGPAEILFPKKPIVPN